MKHFFAVATVLLLCAVLQAQTKSGIKLFNGTYEEAMLEATVTGKYLFTYIRPMDHDSYLFHFKADKELSKRWNEYFVTIDKRYGLMEHPIAFLPENYTVSPSIGGLIIDPAGNLLMQAGSINTAEKMAQILDKTASLENIPRISDLRREFEEGRRDKAFLKKYLSLQDSLGMHTDQQALLAYLNQLQVGELGHYGTVLFLMKCGPLLNGPVHRLSNTNRLADSILKSHPTSVRNRISSRMTQHTLFEAIRKNDQTLLRALIQYNYPNLLRHSERAGLIQNYYMTQFTRFRRDTTQYLQQVKANCDGFFMRIPPDSLAKIDYAVRTGKTYFRGRQLLDTIENRLYEEKYKDKAVKATTRYYAGSLYHGAYVVSQLVDDTDPHLLTAIGWVKRAIGYHNNIAAYHHTLATLLQKAGFVHEALATQQMALKVAKKAGLNPTRFEEQLDQLKAAVKEQPKVPEAADGPEAEEHSFEHEAG